MVKWRFSIFEVALAPLKLVFGSKTNSKTYGI